MNTISLIPVTNVNLSWICRDHGCTETTPLIDITIVGNPLCEVCGMEMTLSDFVTVEA